MATNLKPAFKLSKAVLRGMMKARYGRIIQIGSIVGTSGNPGQTNYAAAKAAVVAFTKSLAQEVGSRNITVNCVAPGFIDTDMTRALPEPQRDALLARIPLGRLGSPEDIGYAVASGLFKRGVLISGTLNNSRVIRAEPPLIITHEEIDTILNRLEDTLQEIRASVSTSGVAVAGTQLVTPVSDGVIKNAALNASDVAVA